MTTPQRRRAPARLSRPSRGPSVYTTGSLSSGVFPPPSRTTGPKDTRIGYGLVTVRRPGRLPDGGSWVPNPACKTWSPGMYLDREVGTRSCVHRTLVPFSSQKNEKGFTQRKGQKEVRSNILHNNHIYLNYKPGVQRLTIPSGPAQYCRDLCTLDSDRSGQTSPGHWFLGHPHSPSDDSSPPVRNIDILPQCDLSLRQSDTDALLLTHGPPTVTSKDGPAPTLVETTTDLQTQVSCECPTLA